MTLEHPFKGTSSERLTALINASRDSSKPLLRAGIDFTFGEPKVYASADRNSQVKLIPTEQSSYKHCQMVYYPRPALTALDAYFAQQPPVVVIASLPFTIHQILPSINSALGLSLEPSEVVDATYWHTQNTYPLEITPRSLGWINSDFHFKAQVLDERIDLSLVIKDLSWLDFDYASNTDWHLTVQELFFQRLNQASTWQIDPDDVDVSMPAPLVAPSQPATIITVTAREDSACFKGQVSIVYNRINIREVAYLKDLTIRKNEACTEVTDLLSQINCQLGIGLVKEDLLDAKLPDICDCSSKSFTLTIDTCCLIYQGSLVMTYALDPEVSALVSMSSGQLLQEPEDQPLVYLCEGELTEQLEALPSVRIGKGTAVDVVESYPIIRILHGRLSGS